MVKVLMMVRWRGRNGYFHPRITTAIAMIVAYTVLVTKRFAERSMFAITRRPSATTPGMVANLPSSNTSWATARVAAAPDPMAIPMSASFNASASFTPSPVIATTWPFNCNAPTMARFCCGVTRPNTACCSSTSASCVGIVGELAGVEGVFGVRQPDARRHRGDGARIVAGDHLEGDALLGEVLQRVGSIGSDLLREHHQRGGL